MNPISNDDIKKLIESQLNTSQVIIEGDGYSYTATIISSDFEQLNTVKRHKLVYAALNKPITDGTLHALTIKTYTPEEFQS